MDTPRYEHDCSDCVYLGQFNKYDLYFCPREPTIIARYSNEGSEYTSGIVFGITSDEVRPGEAHPLRECLIRALMISDHRHAINEHVVRYESEVPERMEWYREVLKLADERIACRDEILKLGGREPSIHVDCVRNQKELVDCVHNLMGIFDNPVARRQINSDMAEEARRIGREIMDKYGRTTWVNQS
jgi:hypothetical protein